MKSKDLKNVVKIRYENGDGPTKMYHDLVAVVSLQIIKLWIKMIHNTGSINLSSPLGCPRTTRTKANILKAKNRLEQKRISTRIFAAKINISKSSVHRILLEDLGCFPYKKTKQARGTNRHKEKRVKFSNCVLNNYTKDDTKKLAFLR